jgi:glycosyltransferase involved in cell wall biosynthesis
MNNARLSIVIPCYNESNNAPHILERFKFVHEKLPFELIIVDDGSKDGTKEVFELELLKPEYNFAQLISYHQNIGYGGALLTGLKEARGDILAWTHADLQTDPEDVVKAYELFISNGGKRVVKGKRVKRKFSEWLLTAGMGIIASAVLGKRLFDVNAQPKLFDRGFYELMKNPPHDFSLDLYWLCLAKSRGYQILEVPVEFKKRLHGESKSAPDFKGRIKTIRRTLKYVFQLKNSNDLR